ncbi:MAG TPA: hypothetical protein VG777_00870, partial [Thermoanaerobaculia bacterium]|nr:hypothetical protein [Thermoanaerobaculia bacterium]
MNRSALRAAGAALAAACLACAGTSRPAAAPAVLSSEIPPPSGSVSFATPLEARATMLMLEDERRFDGPAISAASENPDPAVRAAAAHASGSI